MTMREFYRSVNESIRLTVSIIIFVSVFFAPGTAAAADYLFVGAGDIGSAAGQNDEATAKILDSIFSGGAAGTIFTAGDNVNENPVELSHFNSIFHPTWGRHKSRIKPAVGNHDYLDTSTGFTGSGYYGYFGAAAGDPAKGYYSYTVGTWHFIVINSNCSKVAGGCGINSPQEQWLRQDLELHKNIPCKAAYWHHPLFSSGQHGGFVSMKPIFQALYDYSVDFTIHGHNHVYERFNPQNAEGAADQRGIRQFVAGTGGKSVDYFSTPPLSNEVVRNELTFGVLKFTLHATSYDWEFVPVPGKTFTDSGSDVCNNALQPTAPVCPLKTSGDADCNSVVDLSDFEQFRKEFTLSANTKTADFNLNGNVDIADFEIWRKTYMK